MRLEFWPHISKLVFACCLRAKEWAIILWDTLFFPSNFSGFRDSVQHCNCDCLALKQRGNFCLQNTIKYNKVIINTLKILYKIPVEVLRFLTHLGYTHQIRAAVTWRVTPPECAYSKLFWKKNLISKKISQLIKKNMPLSAITKSLKTEERQGTCRDHFTIADKLTT